MLSFTFHIHSCGTSQREETFGLNTRAEFSLGGFESPTHTSVVLSSQVLPVSFLLCCSQLWVYLLGMQFVSALPHSSPVFLALLQGMGSYKKQQRKCVSEEGSGGLKSGKCRRIVHCSDRNPVLFNRKPGVTDMEVLCAISDFK